MIRPITYRFTKSKALIVGAIVLMPFIFATFLLDYSTTHAAPVTGFYPGRIIDDGVFTNANSMNAGQIQTFLNSKVPTCETWHTSGYGQNPPFICLKDYSENGRSAAQIIYDTAQQYQINPQVLIVLLQKEQGLVTDTWPLNSQYRTATGYGCPDTAPCDSQYYGLTNQLKWSGTMFRAIMNNSSSWYTPYVLGNNFVRWSPDTNCGGSNVYIENRSTQALYNYTPYQPNQSALNAGYGTGDSCGAYGNRNFYLYFKDWFGSVRAINGNVTISQGLTTSKTSVVAGDVINASYEVSNSASYEIEAGGLGICGRLNGAYYDFGFSHHNTIAANGKVTLSYSKLIDRSGVLNLFVCSYNEALGGWASALYPYNSSPVLARNLTLNVQDNPLITSSVSLSPASPAIGQSTTATVTLRNNSNSSVNIGSLVIAGRDPQGRNVDFPIQNDVIIPAGTDYTYSKSRTFSQPGAYGFYVANWNGVWTTSYPKSLDGSIARNLTVNVQ